MPRYFFHVHNGQDRPDEDGEVLADDGAARAVAVRALAEMVEDRQDAWALADGDLTITVVRDEDGPMLLLRAEIAALGS